MQCCGKPLADIDISLGIHYRGIEYKIQRNKCGFNFAPPPYY